VSRLNQFQQYSQEENTVTNNVLLMLSRINDINPTYYQEYINGLTENDSYFHVLPSFQQQLGKKSKGIIDGHIYLKGSRIIIETKLHSLENINKLVKYASAFRINEMNMLFHLSVKPYSETEKRFIEKELEKYREQAGKIFFDSFTYQNLVDQLTELASNYPFENQLQQLAEDFSNYCSRMGLLPNEGNILRVMACGKSFDLNVKHRLYFDSASRGFSRFDYLGIYKWKKVRYIGKVEAEIVADWTEQHGLKVLSDQNNVTEQQKERIVNAIEDGLKNGWDLRSGLRFFLFNEFENTEFTKTSPGGIFRVRYFNLKEYFNEVPNTLKEIAEELNGRTWELKRT